MFKFNADFTFVQNANGPSSVCRGGTANFSCEIVNAGGVLQPNQWRFANNTIITFDTPDHTLVEDDVTSLISNLTVTNIKMSTSYICGTATRPLLMSEVFINVEGMKYVCVDYICTL